MAKRSRIMTSMEGDVAVVNFLDSRILDESNVQAVGAELDELVQKRYILKMILNFAEVSHLSSAVIGKVIGLHKRLAAEKGQLKLCGLNPVVREVFKVTQVDKLVEVHKDVATALKSFQKKRWFGR